MTELLERYPALNPIRHEIESAYSVLLETCRSGGKILVCGNGGSCSDSEHIVGELMKCFKKKRPVKTDFANKMKELFPEDAENLCSKLEGAIPAISLPSQTAVLSAYANDKDASLVYAQLVYGYGRPGDTLIGLTTSGNSKNVLNAFKTAKALGVKTIALTGINGGLSNTLCDVTIHAPEIETYKIQELHLPIYHYLCAKLEDELF